MTQYQRVNKEIADQQNERLIKDLEFKYETLKKEKEIDKLQEGKIQQEAEIEHQKTIKHAFLIGFLVILIPIILLLIVYYQKLQTQSLVNKQQEAINQQEVKTLLQSQELDLAKNAIQIVGESDGSFDANDYILFYGWGPDRWYAQDTVRFDQQKHHYSEFSGYYININPADTPMRIFIL